MAASSPPIVATIADCRRQVAEARRAGRSIGFVPTMGALHDGHVRPDGRLPGRVRLPRRLDLRQPDPVRADRGLPRVPRTPEDDHRRCGEAGVDLVFEPTVEEMYPDGADRHLRRGPGPLGGRWKGRAGRPTSGG